MADFNRTMFAATSGLMRATLTNPTVQKIIGQRTCTLRYNGRRSGKPVELTVWYKERDGGARIAVAMPTRKRWWRNFVGTPHPCEVEIDGVRRKAMALVEGSPETKVVVDVTYAEDGVVAT